MLLGNSKTIKIFNLWKLKLIIFTNKILFLVGDRLLMKDFAKQNFILFLKEIFYTFLQVKIKISTIFL
jgi:hypothetical protein